MAPHCGASGDAVFGVRSWCTRSGRGVRIDLPITQTELAQWCGLSRDAVVKALRELRDLGWFSTTDGTVKVLDRVSVSARGQL